MLFFQAAGGQGGSADPDTAGLHGGSGVIGNQILIHHDARVVQPGFRLRPGQMLVIGPQIDQQQVVVRAAGAESETLTYQFLRQGLAIADDLPGILFEFGLHGLGEGDGLGGNHVAERPALDAGKDGGIDGLGIFLFAHYRTGTRSAQGLVGGAGHKFAHGNRIRMQAGADQAGDMGNVRQNLRVVLAGDFRNFVKIDLPGIRTGPADDQFGFVLFGQLAELVVINGFRIPPDAIADEFIQFAAEIQLEAVAEVAAMGKVHGQNRIARLQLRKIDRHIGLRAGVGLNIGVFAAEELFAALDGELLYHIHIFAAAVVAFFRQPLRIFIGKAASRRHQNRRGGMVLRGNHLQHGLLAVFFFLDDIINFRIAFFEIFPITEHVYTPV
ncbi:MAG: hypothetical protein BWY71_01773 [Planctomycetes bacterium ADurb.Bin412]|nr:MAG: hypothetical protein BWY71_01773 [Planctomycetes bacterium ADurb.Bin412]